MGSWLSASGLYRIALITHWDGQSWTTWEPQQYGELTAVWGTNSSNLYAVGAAGLVIHYDGSNWTQQQSGTSVDLNYIWGLDNTHIFATSFESNTGTGTLLESNGNSWNIVTTGGINPDSTTLYGDFKSIWGSSVNKLNLVGSLSYEGSPGNWKLSNIPDNSEGNNLIGLTGMNHVSGAASNDIFICGDRDLMIHWNGASWYIYNQFFSKTKQSSLQGVWMQNNYVCITGYENSLSEAIVYRGVQ
jgi:hypothetical protein